MPSDDSASANARRTSSGFCMLSRNGEASTAPEGSGFHTAVSSEPDLRDQRAMLIPVCEISHPTVGTGVRHTPLHQPLQTLDFALPFCCMFRGEMVTPL